MDVLQEMLDTVYGVGPAFRTVRNAMNGWNTDIDTMTAESLNDSITALKAISTTLTQAATGERYKVGDRTRGIRRGDLKAPVSAPRALQKSARAIGPVLGVPTSLGIDIIKTVKNAIEGEKPRRRKRQRK